MQPDIEKGAIFMKQITKAALSALFAIGVTSSQNIDKFIEHFSEELMKNYPIEPVVEPTPKPVPTPEASQAPVAAPKEEVDLGVLIKDEEILKILRGAGINSIDQLIIEGQKRSLTEIEGITGVIEDELREELKKYNAV